MWKGWAKNTGGTEGGKCTILIKGNKKWEENNDMANK
jgi:hypothetical protein